MSVRLRYKIEASVSSTSAEEKDLGNVSYEVVYDGSGEGGTRKTLLEAGDTDISIAFTGISASKFVLIRTTVRDPTLTLGEIDLKVVPTGAQALKIVPMTGATEAHLLIASTGITDLLATNPGTVDTDITVLAVGD